MLNTTYALLCWIGSSSGGGYVLDSFVGLSNVLKTSSSETVGMNPDPDIFSKVTQHYEFIVRTLFLITV